MPNLVHRFVARVKPRADHPSLYEWQTATVCLFVGDKDRRVAQARAEQEIRARGWQRIQFIERSTLIEDRVREAGGAVWEAYKRARGGQVAFIEELDEIAFAKKNEAPAIQAPRLTETFIDRVVERAGGRRLTAEEAGHGRSKNADYRLGRFVIELKDLQSEALEIKSRQSKIGELFGSYLRWDRSVSLDPSLLSLDEFRQYCEIVGNPIRRRLNDARDQVRSTLDRLGDDRLRGAVILMNTGYGTLHPDLFYDLARKYVDRSRTLQFVICISSWSVTNGFDTAIHFAFQPDEPELHPIALIRRAFWELVDELMTSWARGGFVEHCEVMNPLRPLVFESAGSVFASIPPKPPSSIDLARARAGGGDTLGRAAARRRR